MNRETLLDILEHYKSILLVIGNKTQEYGGSKEFIADMIQKCDEHIDELKETTKNVLTMRQIQNMTYEDTGFPPTPNRVGRYAHSIGYHKVRLCVRGMKETVYVKDEIYNKFPEPIDGYVPHAALEEQGLIESKKVPKRKVGRPRKTDKKPRKRAAKKK